MNYDVPHTVILVHHNRVRLDFLRPARILGPGVFHFEGDLRYRLRTVTQRKVFDRRGAELHFMPGDSVAVMDVLVKEAEALPKGDARTARLVALFGLKGMVQSAAGPSNASVGDLEIARLTKEAQDTGSAARAATLQARADRFHAAPLIGEEITGAMLTTATPELAGGTGDPIDHGKQNGADAAAHAAASARGHDTQAERVARAQTAGLVRQGDSEMEPAAASSATLNAGPQDDEDPGVPADQYDPLRDDESGEDPVEPEPAPVTPAEVEALVAAAEAVVASAPVVPEEPVAPAPVVPEEPVAPLAPEPTIAETMTAIDELVAKKVADAAATPSPAGDEVVPAAPESAPAPAPKNPASTGKKKNRY